MVQIPEKTDENSEALKAGYKNICEIGKQRIRKVGGKLLAETSTNSHKNNLELFFSSAGASPKAVLLG
jgi:adenine-specific DNA-methyltransferase